MNTAPVKKALWQTLTADPALFAAVGLRIYPGNVLQASPLPAVSYNVVAANRIPTLDGGDSLPLMRFQFDAWAAFEPEAVRVADLILNVLDGFAADLPGLRICGVFAANEWEGPADDANVYRFSRDFRVWARAA